MPCDFSIDRLVQQMNAKMGLLIGDMTGTKLLHTKIKCFTKSRLL